MSQIQTFYRAFEDVHRGSRAAIAERLRVYRPFLLALAQPGQALRALDLGCGRGEWLELLAETGLQGSGVDLDEGMLQACRERALDVRRQDALGALRALPDASLALVSAFHLVEHLPFEQVQQLIAEAHRVLQPGGLLILETPNPENLTVGSSSFYLDPSHERPLPPPLLEFAVEFGGFARRRVLRLQEAPAVRGDGPLALMNVLGGVSPDYAVVAQQAGPAPLLVAMNGLLRTEYGVTLDQLAGRYQAQLDRQHEAIHQVLQRQDAAQAALGRTQGGQQQQLDELQAQAVRLAAQAEQLAADHVGAHNGLLALLQQQGQRLDQLEARGVQLEQHIVALLGSTSWRVTAPLRWCAERARRVRAAVQPGRLRAALRARARGAVLALARAALRRPGLTRRLRALLRHFPALQARLYRMVQTAPPPSSAAPPPPQSDQQLSPRALQAYQQLQQALAARKH